LSLPRLSEATLHLAPPDVARPDYDRAGAGVGVVHFGPGAFHRAHQAAYFDSILKDDRRWGISAVSLNSPDMAEALAPQDGLYALGLLGEPPALRIIGSLLERRTRAGAGAIAARLAAPSTQLITATVTEKGYCLTPEGGLDTEHPAVRADLAGEQPPRTLVGWLVHGLRLRRDAGAGGLTALSCDNLSANGRRLSRAVHDFAAIADPGLGGWIADHVRFPCSMVDAITPATDDVLRVKVADRLGLQDAWPVQRERFSQWVIEDDFAGERPPLEAAGVQFVSSVAAYEEAKLRLLNGAHSSLAYIGRLLGLETVSEAMAEPALAGFIETMMVEDVIPSLHPTPGLDLGRYVQDVLARFREPAVRHLLSQIAWDGSQKLPFRLLGTIAEARAAGRPIQRLAVPIAAWIRFLGLPRPPASPLVDPLAERLLPAAQAGAPDAVLDTEAVFPPALAHDETFRNAVREAWRAMGGPGEIRALLARTSMAEAAT
jgi:fructuronate reductase